MEYYSYKYAGDFIPGIENAKLVAFAFIVLIGVTKGSDGNRSNQLFGPIKILRE